MGLSRLKVIGKNSIQEKTESIKVVDYRYKSGIVGVFYFWKSYDIIKMSWGGCIKFLMNAKGWRTTGPVNWSWLFDELPVTPLWTLAEPLVTPKFTLLFKIKEDMIIIEEMVRNGDAWKFTGDVDQM